MKKKSLHIFYICLLIIGCSPLDLSATHMVGGEINYRCLGGDQYEIMVTVFRDCDTGVPWFDNPASVGVFDINDSLIYDLRLTLRNNDTLNLNLTDPCLVAPPNVCIHTTTYIDTVTLPFQVGGYQVVYQRCCRNQDIVNIVSPTATGATYSSYISEDALLVCNSSARFVEWPPVYVCAGVPIAYDHSAIDVDGDSVVYELCTPFTGATPTQSMPQPPNNPPYNPVTWFPPYSVDNMLGGPDSLVIDPVTGLLTGTPDIIGVFVVGVCAKEYRNGQLISTTRRDFQYVVGICGQLVSSAFFAPQIQCDNSLIVSFQNSSTSLGTGYVWTFGDTLTNASSSISNPTYIYPDTGHYTITLIADPGTLCADTSEQDIYLQYESISADFDVTTANCTDTFYLDVTDLTVDTIRNIADWDWDFGNGQTDTIPYPSTSYAGSGTYIISLNVLAANGCAASFSDTLVLDLPTVFSADSVGICPGDSSVVLNPGGNPNHVYQWSPSTNLSSDTVASPIASPTGTTVYNVTVVVPNGVDTCVLERSITVTLPPLITLDVIRDTITCQDSIVVFANTTDAVVVEWTIDPTFGFIQYVGDSMKVAVTGSTRYYVRATNSVGCFVVDTVDVIKRVIPITANWTHHVLGCDTSFSVQFTDLTVDSSAGAIVAWEWQFGDGNISSQQNPIHTYGVSGNYFVSLVVTTANNCNGIHSGWVSVLIPTITSNDTVGICQGMTTVELNKDGNPSLQYQWSPGATLSDSNAVSPIANPLVPTTYTVTITAINGSDTCVDIQQVHVNFPAPVTVSIPTITTYCGSCVDLLATSPTAQSYQWAGDPSFATILGTGNPYHACPFTFPFAAYYVQATDAYGCTATALAIVQQNPVPVAASFGYSSLGCSDTMAIQFLDFTSDTLTSPIASWLWTTSDGQTSSLQNPIFTFTQSQALTVSLEVTLASGCAGLISQVINLNIASLTNDSIVVLCDGDSTVKLNSGGNADLFYQWSPGTYLDDSTAVEPLVTPPTTPFTYTVTVTGYSSLDTCISIQNVTLVQAPPIVLEVPKDTVTCNGVFLIDATILNAAQIDWSFSPFFVPVAIANVTSFYVGLPNPPYDLSLYVRVTDAYGCTAEDTARVLRRDIPIPVNFTSDINSCEDTLDVTFTNNTVIPAGLQLQGYNWNFGNGETATSFNGAAQYTSNSSHIVSLSATATNGCSGLYIDTLDYVLPLLNSRDSVGLCGVDSVMLNIGGDTSLTYQWSPAAGLSNANIASPMAGPSATTTYTVTVTAFNDLDTCILIKDIVVGVDSFQFEAMPDSVLCFNQVELFVNAPTAAGVDWALDRDFNLIIGQSNPLLTNVNDARWFYVRGYDNYGCVATDSVFVQYRGNDIPVNFSMSPINCGDSLLVNFQDISNDTTITSWNWNFGNGQTSMLQNPSATFYSDSLYTIDLQIQVVGNCNGQVSKQLSAQIPVLEVPNSNIGTCNNDSVQLNIQTNPNLTYVWSPNIGLSDSSSATPMVLPSATTTYVVRVYGYSNFNGVIDTCWLEDSITVSMLPPPVVQIQGDSVLCDSLLALDAIVGQSSAFEWSNTNDFQTIIDNISTLNSSTPVGQQWYYVRVQDSLGCTAIDSVEIGRYDVDINLDSTYIACEGEVIQLIATPANVQDTMTYSWIPGSLILSGQGTDSITTLPTTAAFLSVVGTNQYGCYDVVTTTVDVAPPLDLAVSPDTTLCDPVLLISASSTQAIAQYSWAVDPNFNTILGQNASLQTNAVSNQTVYYIEIEDSLGCTLMDSVIIDYHPADVLVDSASIYCDSFPVQLVATNLNIQDQLTYQWTPASSILSGQGTDTIVVLPTSTTNYTLNAQNQYGCTTTAQTVVTVSSTIPPLAITATQDTVYMGTSAQLIATQQAGYTYTWAVDPTLSSDSIFNPTIQPQSSHTYYLTVTDPFGCTARDSIIIYVFDPVCDDPNVFVPNAFTPDDDGHNDVIYVQGTVITDVYFVIYNRWGEQVFESNDLNIGWDGKYKGKECPPDVYGYYMKCTCFDGNELTKKGNITLLR